MSARPSRLRALAAAPVMPRARRPAPPRCPNPRTLGAMVTGALQEPAEKDRGRGGARKSLAWRRCMTPAFGRKGSLARPAPPTPPPLHLDRTGLGVAPPPDDQPAPLLQAHRPSSARDAPPSPPILGTGDLRGGWRARAARRQRPLNSCTRGRAPRGAWRPPPASCSPLDPPTSRRGRVWPPRGRPGRADVAVER